MVIIMEHSATEEQVQKVIETLVEVGYDVHRSTGVTHTVLGAVGVPRQPLDSSQLELIPGVREVVRISEPYKLVGRTFKSADTVVDIAGVKVGAPRSSPWPAPARWRAASRWGSWPGRWRLRARASCAAAPSSPARLPIPSRATARKPC